MINKEWSAVSIDMVRKYPYPNRQAVTIVFHGLMLDLLTAQALYEGGCMDLDIFNNFNNEISNLDKKVSKIIAEQVRPRRNVWDLLNLINDASKSYRTLLSGYMYPKTQDYG